VTQTVRELLTSQRPTWSFEFFPPKTPEAEPQLWTALRELERLRPSFVSVTYGAGGSTREGTVSVTERIATETTMTPMATRPARTRRPSGWPTPRGCPTPPSWSS
jgi:methylenetetrahydrofolate reductase (NADPH)